MFFLFGKNVQLKKISLREKTNIFDPICLFAGRPNMRFSKLQKEITKSLF
jgi:hypothetical protein